MPVPLSGGSVTFVFELPNVLNTCQTPTDGFPGSPTVAVAIVTTPRFATGSADEPVVVLVVLAVVSVSAEVVASDDLSFEHAVTPRTSAAQRAMSAGR